MAGQPASEMIPIDFPEVSGASKCATSASFEFLFIRSIDRSRILISGQTRWMSRRACFGSSARKCRRPLIISAFPLGKLSSGSSCSPKKFGIRYSEGEPESIVVSCCSILFLLELILYVSTHGRSFEQRVRTQRTKSPV